LNNSILTAAERECNYNCFSCKKPVTLTAQTNKTVTELLNNDPPAVNCVPFMYTLRSISLDTGKLSLN
jgi:hypothetical protein